MTHKAESFALALTHLPSAQMKAAHPTTFKDPAQLSRPPRVRPFNCYIRQVNYLSAFAKAAFDSLARKIKYLFTAGSAGDGFWHKS